MSDLAPPAHDVLTGWREELARLGGSDSMLYFRELPEGTLDLGHAHPSGVAGFLAGRPTRLSSLFRESDALATARRRARAVSLAGSRLTGEHGLPGTHLAVGMFEWQDPPAGIAPQVNAPVLLRPITLQPKGVGAADHELDLGGPGWVNPALVRLLASIGIRIDAARLAAAANGTHGFAPRRVLESLADVVSALPGARIVDRIVVGTFVDLAPSLLAGLDELGPELAVHPVVQALAAATDGGGAANAAWAAAGGASEANLGVPQANPFARDWTAAPDAAKDTPAVTVFTLDPDQREAVQAASRSDVAVLAPPGSGATQAAAQMIVQAAEAGERVLVVAPRRGELQELRDRLARWGLSGLTDDPVDTPIAALDAIPEPGARQALHEVQERWQASLLDVLRVAAGDLSRGGDDAPVTTRRLPKVRFETETLERLVGVARQRAVDVLSEGIECGAFRVGPDETPWYAAKVTTGDEVLHALEAVQRLTGGELAQLRDQMHALADQAGLRRRNTLGEWLRQIDLLSAVRNTLSVFTEQVYEGELGELVVATASPQWRAQHGSTMSMMDRRKYRRIARELLRPQANPGDIHAALVRASQERRDWARANVGGGAPAIPAGLAEAEATMEHVVDDVGYLDRILAESPGADDGSLLDLQSEVLQQRLIHLNRESGSLRAVPRQSRIRHEVAELGLTELADRLKDATEVPEHLALDLEMLWATGVLREMLAAPTVPASSAADPRPEEIGWLREQAERLEPRVATLTTALAVPYRVPANARYDRVLLLGAHRLGLSESVLSVVHGRRLAVIGDPAGTRPMGLDLGEAEGPDQPIRTSVLDAASRALLNVPLRFTHRGPAELAEAGEWVMPAEPELPLAATPRWRVPAPPGQRRLLLEQVADGRTAPAWGPGDPGVVEAPDSEVRRVVDLVLGHAERGLALEARGQEGESLGVITLTRAHGRRVSDMLRLRLRQRPELAQWLLRSGTESFVITDVARAEDVTRDHVILSIGLGLTPHGALLHRFGPLDEEDGPRMLRSAVNRARQRLTLATCLTSSDFEEDRLRDGAASLQRLIRLAQDGPLRRQLDDAGVPDPVLGLLANTLRAAGATVRVTCVDGWPQPQLDGSLAVVPEAFSLAAAVPDLVVLADRAPIAVLWDGRTPGVAAATAVERDALLATALAQLGWTVVNVRAIDVVRSRKALAAKILAATL